MRKSFTKACALVMAAAMAVTGCGNASKTEPSAAAPGEHSGRINSRSNRSTECEAGGYRRHKRNGL